MLVIADTSPLNYQSQSSRVNLWLITPRPRSARTRALAAIE
jgi:hypothetical protein